MARLFAVLAVGLLLGAVVGVVATRPRAAEPVAEPPAPAWGRLVVSEAFLEPPDEVLVGRVCPTVPPRWYFPGFSGESWVETLGSAGLSKARIEELRAAAECDADGCSTQADTGFVATMTPAQRQALYALLARFPARNPLYATPFRQLARHREEWLRHAGLSRELTAQLESMLYGDAGSMVQFADHAVSCASASSDEERLRVMKTLGRKPTLLVRVKIEPGEDVSRMVAWWQRGPRRKSLQPLLGSIARSDDGATLDVAHLMPAFARERLYTYPSADEESLNCFWTSLNFLASEPNAAYAEFEQAQAALAREYHPIEPGEARMGDVIAFVSRDGRLVHTVNYVAEDIVFTKNGNNVFRPWVFMRLADVAALYPDAPVLQGFRLGSSAAPR